MDNDNILQFKPRKFTPVWECECGCQQFYFLQTLEIECCSCGSLVSGFKIEPLDAD